MVLIISYFIFSVGLQIQLIHLHNKYAKQDYHHHLYSILVCHYLCLIFPMEPSFCKFYSSRLTNHHIDSCLQVGISRQYPNSNARYRCLTGCLRYSNDNGLHSYKLPKIALFRQHCILRRAQFQRIFVHL